MLIDFLPIQCGPNAIGTYHIVNQAALDYWDQIAAGAPQIEFADDRPDSASSIGEINLYPTNVGSPYCVALPNSTGSIASISATGSNCVLLENLTLHASPLPPNQFGVFFYGVDQTQVPFGNGVLCVAGGAGGIARLPIEQAGTFGEMEHLVDYSDPPNAANEITAGSSFNFQAWYRDPAAGGAFFNLSDALAITFRP